jgi:hypothetical protein
MNLLIIYNLIIINIIFIIKSKTIEIPFEFFLFSSENSLMNDLYYSQIKTTIKLGSKNQIFNATISFHSENFYIFGEEIKEKNPEFFPLFNRNSSESFEISSSLMNNFFEVYKKSYQSKDKIEFDNLILNKFKFIYALEFNNDFNKKKIPTCAFGLQKFSEGGIRDFSIVNQLKMKNLIEKSTFFFDFEEKKIMKEKGKISFGFDFYSNENILKINCGKNVPKKNKINWSFNFDSVKFGEKKLIYSNDAIIYTEIGLIKAPSEFSDLIQKEFESNFNEKCELLELNNSTDSYKKKFYYSCDKKINVNKIKTLKFYLKKIDFYFVFEGKDLFYEFEGKKIFMIVLTKAASSYWIFGREFLKKYKLFFDEDRKIIGILNENNKNNKNKENENKNNENNNNENNNNKINNNENEILIKNKNFFNIFIIFLFIIIIIIIIIIILTKTKKQKKFIPKLKNENDFSLELKNEYSTDESIEYKQINN